MPVFANRSYQSELLDRTDIPFEDIRRNMTELEIINKYLGGHSITISGLRDILSKSSKNTFSPKPLLICEIGCGGGDNLKAIHYWCTKQKIAAHFIGIDINNDCITYARSNCSMMDVDWITSDYLHVEFSQKPDIIFSSLFCHHFSDDALIIQLGWMKKNTAMGFYINDLHRNVLAYFSIKLLTWLFSKSYLVKNDAPLSVLRGFTRREWILLMEQATQTAYKIKWKWAFRWMIVVIK